MRHVVDRDAGRHDVARGSLREVSEVADALDARATLASEISAQQAMRDAQAARLELAQVRYKNGVANYLDVLDAERELYSAEQTLLSTRLLRLTNAVDLYRSLGG